MQLTYLKLNYEKLQCQITSRVPPAVREPPSGCLHATAPCHKGIMGSRQAQQLLYTLPRPAWALGPYQHLSIAHWSLLPRGKGETA